MPEFISCPQCQRKLRVPDELMGQPVKCPTCNSAFTAEPPGAPLPAGLPRPEEPWRPRAEQPRPPEPRRRSRYADDYEDDAPRGRYEDDDFPRRRHAYADYAPHRGTTVLVLGILSLVLWIGCGIVALILGIIAWVMGNSDLAEIRAGRMDPEGESATNAGRVCGIISVVGGLVLIFFVLIIVLLTAAGNNRW